MDQGRDALLVSNVLNGTTSLPLLGPRASGTQFKLGPIYYYFEIFSAKIFGNYPDKIAYPDWFFSILAIPLLFFFLRKYFDSDIALSVTAVFSTSFFIVLYSRYAWNPNSTPFWTILSLYGIHGIISQKNNHKIFWAIVTGLAIGVVVQLHTLSLAFLPAVIILTSGYLFVKKIKSWKYFFIILILALMLNVPQFIHEFQTHGQNTQEFIIGIEKEKFIGVSNSITKSSICWVNNNVYAISGYAISDSCQIRLNKDSGMAAVAFLLGSIFVVGGIIIGINYLRKERDWDKKCFLAIVFLYMAIAYVVCFFVADKLEMRYFLMMALFPFVTLGFWMKFLTEKFHRRKGKMVFILVGLFIISNVFLIGKSFVYFAECEKGKHAGTTIANVTLKEIEGVSEFIINHSNKNNIVYVNGKSQLVKKMFNSINFFTVKENIKVLSYKKNGKPKGHVFYLAGRNSRNKRKMLKKANPPIPYALSGRVLIFVEEN